jgi:hemoglobin-like flavoprotein
MKSVWSVGRAVAYSRSIERGADEGAGSSEGQGRELMTTLHVELLEESFDLIAPRGEELVASFYSHLFAADPTLRSLFARTDMARQRSMLLAALVLVRKSSRNLSTLVPALVSMGARQHGYGVRPEHYTTVGAVLLAAMAEIGGAAWRAEYTAAWTAAYAVVRDTMLQGAAEASAAEAAVARSQVAQMS